jgi:magnesium chelatase family protein
MIREGKDRILSALAHLGIHLPTSKILVSLHPGSVKKEGSHFDLPILYAILQALGHCRPVEQKIFLWGELGLQGEVRPLLDALPHWIGAQTSSARLLVDGNPAADSSAIESYFGSPWLHIAHSQDLMKLCLQLTDSRVLDHSEIDQHLRDRWLQKSLGLRKPLQGNSAQLLWLALASLGRFHTLLEGVAGVGKSTWLHLLKDLQRPMPRSQWRPAFSIEELIERPFLCPHHSSSKASVVGGGSGEIHQGALSRAHQGILFLDELPEFSKDVLEALREPMTTQEIVIARGGSSARLPAETQILAAMNPCRCGRSGVRCTCSTLAYQAYRTKVSEPLRNRFYFDIDWSFSDERTLLQSENAITDFKFRLWEADQRPAPKVEGFIEWPTKHPRKQEQLFQILMVYGRWLGASSIGQRQLQQLIHELSTLRKDQNHALIPPTPTGN